MTGPISKAILPFQLKTVDQIDQIHAVSFVTVLSANLQARCAVSEKPDFFPAARALGPAGWKAIFSYLTIREIYTFLISSPAWSQCIDLNQFKNEIVLLKSDIQLSPNLLLSLERVGLHSMRIENAEVINSMLNQVAGKVEIDCLDLSGTNVPCESILPFIQRSRALKELDLNNCTNLGGRYADLIPGSLPSLKKINLGASNIRDVSLPYLLYAVTNIEELNLSDYVGYSTCIQRNTGEPILTKLKRLNLNRGVISSEGIIQFLKAAVHLEELQIEEYPCVDPLNLIGLEPNSLLSLRSISFRQSPLEGAGLLAFLKAAPNLQHIDLNDVRRSIENEDQYFPLSLRGFFDHLPEGSLPLLQEIDLGNTDVSPQDIERLHIVAPNLKLIQLTD